MCLMLSFLVYPKKSDYFCIIMINSTLFQTFGAIIAIVLYAADKYSNYNTIGATLCQKTSC